MLRKDLLIIFVRVKKTNTYKIIFSSFLVGLACVTFGAFSGNIGDDGSKFNLKDLGRYSPKSYYGGSYASSSLKQFTFKGSEEISSQFKGNAAQFETMIRLQKGNTTYVYPYKYKVQAPKFKTPSPLPFR